MKIKKSWFIVIYSLMMLGARGDDFVVELFPPIPVVIDLPGGTSDPSPSTPTVPSAPDESHVDKQAMELAASLDSIEKELNGLGLIGDLAELDQSILEGLDHIQELSSASESLILAGLETEQDNAGKSKSQKELADAKSQGDPVIVSNGSYIQNEIDFTIGKPFAYEIKRNYSSASKIVSSFGYGWSTNLDERIILGTDSKTIEGEQALTANYNELKAKISKLETNVSNTRNKIREKINRCKTLLEAVEEIQSKLDRLYSNTVSSYLKEKISRIRSDCYSQKNKLNNTITRLNQELNDLQKDVQKLNEYKEKASVLLAQLNEYKRDLSLSQENHNKNQKALFEGMEHWYEQTGLNTLTVIDSEGYPHLLYEAEEQKGLWHNLQDKEIKSCRESSDGYTVEQTDGFIKQYNAYGFIIRITDRNGNSVEIKRDDNEKIATLQTSSGEIFDFQYQEGLVKSIINTRDKTECFYYAYTGKNLTQITDNELDYETMLYDSQGHMTSLCKCDGSSIQFVYGAKTPDAETLVTSTIDEEGFSEQFDYDTLQNKTEYTDHDGNRYVYYFDNSHKILREEQPDGTVILNTWDEEGNLVSQNKNGCIVNYTYDEVGNMLRAVYDDFSFEEWTWDSNKLLTSYKDRDGVLIQNIRDDRGNIIEYRRGGKTIWTQYFDSKGQLTYRTVYGQQEIKTSYTYDSSGNLIQENTASVITEYEYDKRNRIIKIFRNGKTFSELSYQNHKTTRKDYNGLKTEYMTDSRKDITQIVQTDCISGIIHKTRIEYDRRHLPLKLFTGDGKTERLYKSFTYTPEGKLKEETFHGNQNWSKTYEYKNGTICEIKQQKDGEQNVFVQKYDYQINSGNEKLLSVTDGLGIQTLFYYDCNGNLIKQTDGNGTIKGLSYTKAGRLSAEQGTYGGWYEYDYNSDGLLISSKEQNGAAVQTEYYPDGSIKNNTDRYGRISVYNYDRVGRVSSIQSESQKLWYEYDGLNRVIKKLVGANPENPVLSVSYEYSEDGRTVTMLQGQKYKTICTMDAFGNIIKQTDGNGNSKRFEYDTQNQLTASYDGYENKTSYEYNALGYVNALVLPGGETTDYQYNYMGLLAKITDECGTVYSASYDKAGRLIRERNRTQSEKSYEYDKAGRITKILCGGKVIQSYDYSDNGRSVIVKDGNSNNYLYNYDSFGRLISERNRNGDVQNYLYDSNGQLQQQNSFDESTIVINYSQDRNERTVYYSDGNKNHFVYDMTGNVIQTENEYGKTVYQYDRGGCLVYQKDSASGEEIFFEYDPAGNRTKLRSSNRETVYKYGKNNELLEVFDNKQRLRISLKYDSNGREVQRNFSNGNSINTSYDRAGRIILITQKSSLNELVWAEGYAYGSDGKRTLTVDNKGQVTFYEYNEQGQLASVWYPYSEEFVQKLKAEAQEYGLQTLGEAGLNRFITASERDSIVQLMEKMQYGLSYNLTTLQILIKESFDYDLNGNRIAKTNSYGKITYTYDAENRLLFSGAHGKTVVKYTYDKNGNLLSQESELKKSEFAYNSQNRLIYSRVTQPACDTCMQTSYGYDSFGRRVFVQDKGQTALRTLYDGFTFDVIKQSPVFANGTFTDSLNTGVRWNGTGNPTGDRYRYISDDDTPTGTSSRYHGERTQFSVNGTLAAQASSDGLQFFTTDLLGSIRGNTDNYGTEAASYSYDAFGSLVQGNLSGNSDIGYTGKQLDPTTTLYNYGYRDYNPSTTRFTTPDPIRDGPNWFTYCTNDPINFIDLWGLCASDNSVIGEDIIRVCLETNNKCIVTKETIQNTDIVLEISVGVNVIGDKTKVDVAITLDNRITAENNAISSPHAYVSETTVKVKKGNKEYSEYGASNADEPNTSVSLIIPTNEKPLVVDIDIHAIAINQKSEDNYYYQETFK